MVRKMLDSTSQENNIWLKATKLLVDSLSTAWVVTNFPEFLNVIKVHENQLIKHCIRNINFFLGRGCKLYYTNRFGTFFFIRQHISIY